MMEFMIFIDEFIYDRGRDKLFIDDRVCGTSLLVYHLKSALESKSDILVREFEKDSDDRILVICR